ncbi:hypothetical protein [Bradyrhizobium sp. BRP56]|uniref:hypothetical protein n=1 Tax=Bradyrhizobium sp. BRP56 TaxID=2793819 RepID=UPI003207C216|nr:hypothetical protein [Bradyrhizobium sp. BRP56]
MRLAAHDPVLDAEICVVEGAPVRAVYRRGRGTEHRRNSIALTIVRCRSIGRGGLRDEPSCKRRCGLEASHLDCAGHSAARRTRACMRADPARPAAFLERRPEKAIADFVTREGGRDLVPPAEHMAMFNNDGTLWTEQPFYFQLAFTLDRDNGAGASVLEDAAAVQGDSGEGHRGACRGRGEGPAAD